jgi:23S rRNA pseudouridine955/2504/2580 synthase
LPKIRTPSSAARNGRPAAGKSTTAKPAAPVSGPRPRKPSKLIQAGLDRRSAAQTALTPARTSERPVAPARAPPAAPRREAELAPRELKVDADRGGQRLDNFLLGQLKGVPRTLIYRLLRKGAVRIDGKRAKQDARLDGGETIQIPEIRQATAQQPLLPGPDQLGWLQDRILYEDRGLLVLDKPVGLACHGGSGLSFGAIEALRALKPTESLELVHRLDRDTSGLLLIAKKRSVLKALQEQIRGGLVDKRYVALLIGAVQPAAFAVDAPLLKNTLNNGERVVRVDSEGKEAHSRFRVIERYTHATFVECELLTGRTHQIRVHTRHFGHPIVGDSKYGDAARDRLLPSHEPQRMWLHAWRLRFELDGQTQNFEAPEPAELIALRARLRSAS